MLERADKTSRILDVKYFLLLPKVDDVGTTVDDIQWAAVLRSASAFEMYRKRHGRISPTRIVEFLLLDRDFPRAIHYSPEGRHGSRCTRFTGTPTGDVPRNRRAAARRCSARSWRTPRSTRSSPAACTSTWTAADEDEPGRHADPRHLLLRPRRCAQAAVSDVVATSSGTLGPHVHSRRAVAHEPAIATTGRFAVAARRPASPGASLPDAGSELLAESGAAHALPQLAAGSARQLPGASRISGEDARAGGGRRSGRRVVGHQPVRLLPRASAETFPFTYEPWLAKDLAPFLDERPPAQLCASAEGHRSPPAADDGLPGRL